MRIAPLSRCLDSLKPLQCAIIALQSSINPQANRTFSMGHIMKHQTVCPCSRRDFSSTSAESSVTNWNSVPVVKAFVYVPKNSSSNPIVGVYWHDKSKQNRFKEHAERTKTTAEIEAVCLALKQAALKMNLPRIHIVTNSKFVCKHFGKTSLWWNWDEFLQHKAMSFSFCRAEAEDLYRLLHMTEAKLEYDPSIDETAKKFYENLTGTRGSKKESETITQFPEAPETSSSKATAEKQQKRDAGSKTASTSSSAAEMTSSASKYQAKNTPVVYTCGVLHCTEEGEKKFTKAGYGVYWPHAEELGTGRRYNFYPMTLVRCQLQAIVEALQQAIDRNYPSIVLRTDCVTFLVHHSRQWMKTNGAYVKYHDQYLRIMDLCKNIKVRFQSANNDPNALREAEALAENGICLPLPSKRFRKSAAAIVASTSDDKISATPDVKCCA